MIDMPTIESIHTRRARDDSVAEIARAEGISEPTVRKYLEMEDFSPKFPAKKQRFSILDPYKTTIERWLDEDGTLVATHRRAYGTAPTDSEDPLSQLGLLCSKPGGWQNSIVRHALPDTLREAIDCLERPERASALRALRDISAELGYKHAVAGMLASVESLGSLDIASSEIMARSLADGRGRIVYDEEVGLGDYDVAFSAAGGGADEPL